MLHVQLVISWMGLLMTVWCLVRLWIVWDMLVRLNVFSVRRDSTRLGLHVRLVMWYVFHVRHLLLIVLNVHRAFMLILWMGCSPVRNAQGIVSAVIVRVFAFSARILCLRRWMVPANYAPTHVWAVRMPTVAVDAFKASSSASQTVWHVPTTAQPAPVT